MSSFCSTPESWFQTYQSTLDYWNSSNSCFPFSNVTPDQLIQLITPLSSIPTVLILDQLSAMILMPLGIIGSLCSILAVWRKAIKKHDHFYLWMLCVAVMDFLVNSLHFPATLSKGRLFENLYKYSYAGTQTMCVFYGLTAGFSLASDLCTLALTVERFLGICKPTSFQGANKRRYRLVIKACVIAISSIRLCRYSMEYHAAPEIKNETTYVWSANSITSTRFFEVMVDISDLIFPFLLLISMVYFSSRIAAAVIARNRKNRVGAGAASTASRAAEGTSEIASKAPSMAPRVSGTVSATLGTGASVPIRASTDRTKSMLQLLAILVSLFILNQIGYCLYATAYIRMMFGTVSFDSTPVEIGDYVAVVVYREYVTCFSIVAECVSRTTSFYFYYAFSLSIRDDFRRAIRCRGETGPL